VHPDGCYFLQLINLNGMETACHALMH